ncbi:hypothetical protein O181_070811 [Austropuccinia psidii MF-1]|uniref:Uncharacterized protein n=1 Tax=Austropuccinia psidii MF-1 TaxID=1389203 RepID=A0A9Q3F660_9BASI|nr:hypothetical protein [Austropuccinia psidii MF-1]
MASTVHGTLRPLSGQKEQRGPTTYPQSQFWPPISPVPEMAKRTQDPNLPFSTPGLCKSPEATSSSSEGFPLHSGERLPFTNVLRTMDYGMVHIWYDIPLCTNFAQPSNCYGFRTKLSPKIHNPFQRVFSVIQFCNSWWVPEDHPRTPTTWPCRGWVVFFLFRIISRKISRGYQASNNLSRHQLLLYSLDNSIGPYRL